MSRVRSTLVAVGCVLVAAAIAAPSAFAGRVSYAVPAGPSYTVTAEGHGHGIVKVTINECLVAGQAFQLPLQVTAGGPYKGTPSAQWKVMKDGSATLAFDPSTVTFDQPSKSATLTITAGTPRNQGDFLRFKLAPTPGSGLGEGPGYMVRYACVLAPTPAGTTQQTSCPPAQTRDKNGAPNQNASSTAGGNDGATAPAPSSSGQSGTVPNNNDNGRSEDSNGRAGGGTPGRAEHPDDPVCPSQPATTSAGTTDSASAPAGQPTTPTANTIVTSSGKAARCIATPRSLRVTAGEQNVITIRVATNGVAIRHALLRMTTPDGVVFHRTDRRGLAVFRIRPSKTGSVTVRSDVCFGVRSARVHRARVSSRHLTPAFTG